MSLNLRQIFNIKEEESKTVSLFFLHNFFLGIASILVYVSANVILLENHPETSLPLAYMASALILIIVGKIYSYFEHHLSLQNLAIRSLWVAIIICFLVMLLVFTGHSVGAAIAIMVGYRIIYLLTNLEFWGVSSIVFNVRQSKRLFSVISAGDMPAKAIGAILAVFVHHHTEIYVLLAIAFFFFFLAILMLYQTFKTQSIHTSHQVSLKRRQATKLIQQLFGGNHLIFSMCLSIVPVALIATGIEYAFFVNVKHKVHSQAELAQLMGMVLFATYLFAFVVKLIFSHKTLDKFGILPILRFLPVAAGLGILVYIFETFSDASEQSFLLFYGLLYMIFEVIRRSLFDPVYLVLFQPLNPHQRLMGHTLVKGFYEPLGMGIAGLIIYAFTDEVFMFCLIVVAIVGIILLNKTYKNYLLELKDAISKRFLADKSLAITGAALKLIEQNLSSEKPEEVLNSIDWLKKSKLPILQKHLSELIKNPTVEVRQEVMELVENKKLILEDSMLKDLALNDNNSEIRQQATQILVEQNKFIDEFLQSNDKAAHKGIILGSRNNKDILVKELFDELKKSPDEALLLILEGKLTDEKDYVRQCLTSEDIQIRQKAIETVGTLQDESLLKEIVPMLNLRQFNLASYHAMVHAGELALVALPDFIKHEKTSLRAIKKIALLCEKSKSDKAQSLLMLLLDSDSFIIRQMANYALRDKHLSKKEKSIIEQLVENELIKSYKVLAGVIENIDTPFVNSLENELQTSIIQLFLFYRHLYDKEALIDAQSKVSHNSHERRANAIEVLENIVSKKHYHCLYALISNKPYEEKLAIFESHFSGLEFDSSCREEVLQKGAAHYSDWTIALALYSLDLNQKQTINYLKHYQLSDNRLLVETTREIISKNALKEIELMKHHNHENKISILERIIVLKNTSLFGDTPDNILSSIAHIMKEDFFEKDFEIFKKGDWGNCMYVIFSGGINIYDESKMLATFAKGDFFGELSLLDMEPRSASATTTQDCLLLRLDHEDFYDLMDERPEVMQNMMKILCQRIRGLNTKVRELSEK